MIILIAILNYKIFFERKNVTERSYVPLLCTFQLRIFGPRQANLALIAYASSEVSGEPAHPRSLARTSAARSYKQWIKRNLQTESQIPSPSEWLGMRSWNLSWRNARRHKFAWRGSNFVFYYYYCPLIGLSLVFSQLPGLPMPQCICRLIDTRKVATLCVSLKRT